MKNSGRVDRRGADSDHPPMSLTAPDPDAPALGPPPFTVSRPATPSPLVFASPHSGELYPSDMAAAAPGLADPRSAEDALVDRLIAGAPAAGAATLSCRLGRAYVDVNRDPGELDPELIDGAPPSGARSPRVAAGLGVIARLDGLGRPIYDRRLGLAEAQARVAAVHAPYHAALAGLMDEARARFGVAVLIDWHSMPSRAAEAERRRTGRAVDIVLGDRHGAACARVVSATLRQLFEQAGWRVGLNQPYAGGYTTQLWGRPDEGFHAVQVEIDRGLYLDEATRTPGPGFERTQRRIARVIAAFAARDWAGELGGA